jgi:hypothetical protein
MLEPVGSDFRVALSEAFVLPFGEPVNEFVVEIVEL